MPKKGLKSFEGSKNYWEKRYQRSGNSGSGSYGRLSEFKAKIINDFVKQHQINSVIELGCGDGNQLLLANYPSYIGFDVSEKALTLCRSKFESDQSKQFFNMLDASKANQKAELGLSLDVIYHLIEDEVYDDYMQRLFESATKYVIIYSSNYDEHLVRHVKCRTFTNWIDTYVAKDWELIDIIKNNFPFDVSNPNETSRSDFYFYKNKNLEMR